MIIGKFTREGDTYKGELKTLMSTLPLTFERTDGKVDYRITTDEGAEVGAAWKETSERSGNEYLSVQIDSPFLEAPIYAALLTQDEGHILVWTRNKKKAD